MLFIIKRKKHVSTGFRFKPGIKHSNEEENNGYCICCSNYASNILYMLAIRHLTYIWDTMYMYAVNRRPTDDPSMSCYLEVSYMLLILDIHKGRDISG